MPKKIDNKAPTPTPRPPTIRPRVECGYGTLEALYAVAAHLGVDTTMAGWEALVLRGAMWNVYAALRDVTVDPVVAHTLATYAHRSAFTADEALHRAIDHERTLEEVLPKEGRSETTRSCRAVRHRKTARDLDLEDHLHLRHPAGTFTADNLLAYFAIQGVTDCRAAATKRLARLALLSVIERVGFSHSEVYALLPTNG
ncbi:MAG: hypothetical protein EPO40_17520 [Myxococcaceae bacterium]|nr:MAG: hypothetical protein EPO40_17520 [Myxococcaceae bacterium]